MSATAVVVAAGAGTRLGGSGPKGLVPLGGVPLFVHSVRTLLACPGVDEVVVVIGEKELDRARQAATEADLVDARWCAGGRTRTESVAAGLAACSAETGIIAVHDAARPLVSMELVERALGHLHAPWDAVAPALPVVDTLKAADGDRVLRTVARDGLYAVQTPQVFTRSLLQSLHGAAVHGVTDDLTLVERTGGNVRLVPGERRNFKVTYPEDLRLAEALLA